MSEAMITHQDFERLEQRVVKLEGKQKALETSNNDIGKKLDLLINSMNTINTRLDGIETRLDSIETKLDGVETTVRGTQKTLSTFVVQISNSINEIIIKNSGESG